MIFFLWGKEFLFMGIMINIIGKDILYCYIFILSILLVLVGGMKYSVFEFIKIIKDIVFCLKFGLFN